MPKIDVKQITDEWKQELKEKVTPNNVNKMLQV